MQYYKFSVVIPTLNEEDYISTCITSILSQSYSQKLIEILIVDGGSSDETLSIVKDFKNNNNNIFLYKNPKRRTPISLNIGVKNSTGDFVIILGAHTKVDKNFIFNNNKHINEQNVKVCGGTQINVGKTFIQKIIAKVMEIPFAMASASYRWSEKAQFVDTVVYAAYKKELFEELGYFEENYSISEDAEMNWRIRQAGYKIFFSPDIKTFYFARGTVKNFIKQMFRYGILRVNVVKKHLDALKIVHLIPPLFVIAIISLILLMLFTNLSPIYLISFFAIYFSISFAAILKSDSFKKIYLVPLYSFLIFGQQFAWGLGFLIGTFLPKSTKW